MNRVLLIHGGALGDFVMTLRLVDGLRRAGAGEVHVLGRPASARWAARLGLIDGLTDIETGGFHALFTRSGSTPPSVRAALFGFDLIIDMLGTESERLRELGLVRVVFLDPRPREGDSRHIIEQWTSVLRETGIPCRPGPPGFEIPPAFRLNARSELESLVGSQRPVALIHPGSGSRKKCWPEVRFLKLIDLLQDAGLRCVCLLGPVEVEQTDPAGLVSRANAVLRCPPIERLASYLAVCDLHVGNDSGVSHLAAAVGARSIVIFGPTPTAVWAPRGPRTCICRGVGGSWPSVDEVWDAVAGEIRDRAQRTLA